MEALESRVLYSVAGTSANASNVHLLNAWGGATSISKTQNVWMLFHGLNMNWGNMTSMASALQSARPADQVIIVDWSPLATYPGGWHTGNPYTTADYVASLLKQAGVRASHVNLVGFSMGGSVIGRLAKDLHSRRSIVNRIVALDPAGSGGASFAAESNYSIAFTAADKYSDASAYDSADDTVLITGLPSDPMSQHSGVFATFTDLLMAQAGQVASPADQVASLFSVNNILGGSMPTWRKDAYAGQFEAEMQVQPLAGSWLYEPVALSYLYGRHASPRYVR